MGPLGQISGTFVAPTLLPGPPVGVGLPAASPWGRGALVLLLFGATWMAARRGLRHRA
jgi:hypothetical protein